MTISQFAKAQLSAADSVWFTQIFDEPKYANDSAFPGNWFIHDTIHSTAQLYSLLDSSFKFKLEDFDHISSMTVNDTLFYDTLRNNTYNSYPFVFQQNNPLTYLDFTLNGKNGRAYSFFYPKTPAAQSDYAYLVLQGGGSNETTQLVQGGGYHNSLCYVTNNLKLSGDVYAYMRPNEDARAIYWNKLKLNVPYMSSYLETVKHQYGLNYLTEIIATVNYLKKNYCKVIIMGLSEGGYAGLLASIYTRPDAAIISGGYAVGFDTSGYSYSILQGRFDSLVFTFDKDTIKNIIASNDTKYLFTWGYNDGTNLMKGEHDSNYTQLYFNDSINCSYFYDFPLHTFPYCHVIDSFASKTFRKPLVNFYIPYTTDPDSLVTLVTNCGTTNYSFNLFRNDTFYQSYSDVPPDTLITLVDSGRYYLQNIVNIYGDSVTCADTIIFNKVISAPSTPDIVKSFEDEIKIQYNNPVNEQLQIKITNTKNIPYYYILYDIYGVEKIKIHSKEQRVNIDMRYIPSGIYFMKVSDGMNNYAGKIIKS